MSTFAGRRTRNFQQDHASDPSRCVPDQFGYCPCPLELEPEATAQLVCSDTGTGHKPLIDFDLPVQLIPSGTKGHSHLYIDHEVTFEQYMNVLKALSAAGLVEWGFVNATEQRGFGSLRHPDRPKDAPS